MSLIPFLSLWQPETQYSSPTRPQPRKFRISRGAGRNGSDFTRSASRRMRGTNPRKAKRTRRSMSRSITMIRRLPPIVVALQAMRMASLFLQRCNGKPSLWLIACDCTKSSISNGEHRLSCETVCGRPVDHEVFPEPSRYMKQGLAFGMPGQARFAYTFHCFQRDNGLYSKHYSPSTQEPHGSHHHPCKRRF